MLRETNIRFRKACWKSARGACVNVAFYRSLNPAMRTTVVDLPETIIFGYCFLKSVFPDIRSPTT